MFVGFWLTSEGVKTIFLFTSLLSCILLLVMSRNRNEILRGLSHLMLAFASSTVAALFLSGTGLRDASLGQDYISYYAWYCFLFGLPALYVGLLLKAFRKG